jgi:hypothetical protein
MRPKREVSIADGFWTSLTFTGPLLAVGILPGLPASVQAAALFLGTALGLAAMVRPFLHWPARGAAKRVGPSKNAIRRMKTLQSQG